MGINAEGALCTTATNTISCTTVEILEFGFVTMPFMAGAVFISILTLIYLYKKIAQN